MDGYLFDHVRLDPARQIGLHEQDTWELSFVAAGAGVRTLGPDREPFAAGDVVLVPPGVPHGWFFDREHTDRRGRIENMTLTFRTEFVEGLAALFPALAGAAARLAGCRGAVIFSGERAKRIAELLRRMCTETEPERAASVVRLLAAVAERGDSRTAGCCRRPDATAQRLAEVRIYVSCNLGRPIALDEVARHVGMNCSAFCTFFRKHAGQTFVEYLTARRIDAAERMLRAGGRSVAEVCYACGFNSPAHFSRVFRRLRGTAPSRIGC